MKFIFGALATFATVIVLLAGSGVLWLTTSGLEEAKQESVKNLVIGLADTVSSQMQVFEQTVNKFVDDNDIIMALASTDPVLMESAAQKIQTFLPDALKVRLLPATVNATDELQVPVMGYADLEMVKKTLISKQLSQIQGAGVNRHLAVTAVVKKNNQVIGVILASIKPDFLTKILQRLPIRDNFIQIRQDSVVIGDAGSLSVPTDNSQTLAIANSPWQILYTTSGPQELSINSISTMMVFVCVLALLACISVYLAYMTLIKLLEKDEKSVVEAVKKIMMNRAVPDYGLNIPEMQSIVFTLVQFKRILDNKGIEAVTEKPEDEISSLLRRPETKSGSEKSESGFFKKKK